jgi:large subunit ribosomal protein L24e
MVQRRTCDYTGKPIEPGTGIMYIANDGTVLQFVDSKAEKNYLMGREARDLEWTEAGRANKGPVQQQIEADPDVAASASEEPPAAEADSAAAAEEATTEDEPDDTTDQAATEDEAPEEDDAGDDEEK